MKDTINVKWMGDMAFEAGLRDHKLLMDTNQESGGHNTGPRPKAVLLASLAGCTGMDVVSILKKMKIEPSSLNIRVEGEGAEEHPKLYNSMHLIYEFTGKDLPIDRLNRAVELSQDKYCAVSQTLRKGIPITWEIRVL